MYKVADIVFARLAGKRSYWPAQIINVAKKGNENYTIRFFEKQGATEERKKIDLLEFSPENVRKILKSKQLGVSDAIHKAQLCKMNGAEKRPAESSAQKASNNVRTRSRRGLQAENSQASSDEKENRQSAPRNEKNSQSKEIKRSQLRAHGEEISDVQKQKYKTSSEPLQVDVPRLLKRRGQKSGQEPPLIKKLRAEKEVAQQSPFNTVLTAPTLSGSVSVASQNPFEMHESRKFLITTPAPQQQSVVGTAAPQQSALFTVDSISHPCDNLAILNESPSFGNSPKRAKSINESPNFPLYSLHQAEREDLQPLLALQSKQQTPLLPPPPPPPLFPARYQHPIPQVSVPQNSQPSIKRTTPFASTVAQVQQQQQRSILSAPQHDDIAYRLQNRVIPILEDKIEHPYGDDIREVWVCEVIELLREFSEKNFQGEYIFDKNYGMLFEQVYDGFLTLSKRNRRDYQYVLNILLRTMREIDKKILGYYHDYSRLRGGQKLRYNREMLRCLDTAETNIIKIEDNIATEGDSNAQTQHAQATRSVACEELHYSQLIRDSSQSNSAVSIGSLTAVNGNTTNCSAGTVARDSCGAVLLNDSYFSPVRKSVVNKLNFDLNVNVKDEHIFQMQPIATSNISHPEDGGKRY